MNDNERVLRVVDDLLDIEATIEREGLDWDTQEWLRGVEKNVSRMLANAPSAALARTLRNRLGVIYANVDDEGVSG